MNGPSEAGAVNTIVNRDGRLTGHNTDGYGFLRALREGAGFEPRGRRTLILGAGGAARGVVLALAREGVGELTIANRTPERAKDLARLGENRGRNITARAIPLNGASDLSGSCFQRRAHRQLHLHWHDPRARRG